MLGEDVSLTFPPWILRRMDLNGLTGEYKGSPTRLSELAEGSDLGVLHRQSMHLSSILSSIHYGNRRLTVGRRRRARKRMRPEVRVQLPPAATMDSDAASEPRRGTREFLSSYVAR